MDNKVFIAVYDKHDSHIRSVECHEEHIAVNVHEDETYKVVDTFIEIGVSTPEDRASKQTKYEKSKKLNNIKVTTEAGNTFDGDEKSQDRMSKALLISTLTDDTETDWKLADNSIVTIAFDELKEALHLAITELGNIILS